MNTRLTMLSCVRWSMAVAVMVAGAPLAARAQDVTVTVKDDLGSPVPTGFRWLLEEDNTFFTVPGRASPNAPLGSVPGDPSFTLAVNIHHSHAPTVCAGDTQPA